MENPAVNIKLYVCTSPESPPSAPSFEFCAQGVAGVERLLGEAAGEGECLRNRSDGQRAPMPQLKAGKRNSSAGGCTCLLQISKSRRSSRAAGRNRALRRQLGQERLLHKYTRPFAAPSRQKQSLRHRRLHLCPAQRKNFFSRWTAGPFQADGAVRTGLGDGANGRADRTCNASGHCAGPWDTIVLAMALVVLLERHRS